MTCNAFSDAHSFFKKQGDINLSSDDNEMLARLLSIAMPQHEAKETAHNAIREFGSCEAVFAASKEQLQAATFIGQAARDNIWVVSSTFQNVLRKRIVARDLLGSSKSLHEYCRARIAHLRIEVCYVLYLDHKNQLIADEELSRGTIDHVPVYPREVFRRALELDATKLVLVHNHPSGSIDPSWSDREMTAMLVESARILALQIIDHLIVAPRGVYSFREHGLITD